MISNSIIKYLDTKDEFKLTPEYQEKFKKILLNHGISGDSALFDLMTTYSGEFHGKYGFIINVADDLSDYENSVTKQLIENEKIGDTYISLFNFEFDDYLLYNKEDDSVVLIDGGNIQNLKNGVFSKKWNSFDQFLIDYFDL